MKIATLLLAVPLALACVIAIAQTATTTTTQSAISSSVPEALRITYTQRNIRPKEAQSETVQAIYPHSDGTIPTDVETTTIKPLVMPPTTIIMHLTLFPVGG